MHVPDFDYVDVLGDLCGVFERLDEIVFTAALVVTDSVQNLS